MELAERRLLLTSLTDIGVKGVNVLPTKNKMTKLKKRTTQIRKKKSTATKNTNEKEKQSNVDRNKSWSNKKVKNNTNESSIQIRC